MPRIDPSARVADGARLADDVEVGPFCTIGPDVELKAGVRLMSHVAISGHTVVGERCTLSPFVSLGGAPQSTGYRGEPTRLAVGIDCQFREGVTINTGTVKGGGITTIGDRCFFMAQSHAGHDCVVGNDVVMANGVALAGHVTVGNNVFIGGLAAIHQFNRIGDGAMIAGLTGVTRDVIPFASARGAHPCMLAGLNVVGLRRRGFSRADIRLVHQAYEMIFFGDGVFADRVARARDTFAGDKVVAQILDFIVAKRPRALMHPARGDVASDDAE